MTGRPTASTVTDPQLEQLYAELDTVRADNQRMADLVTAADRTRQRAAADADRYEADLRAERDTYRKAWHSAKARARKQHTRAERAEQQLAQVRAECDDQRAAKQTAAAAADRFRDVLCEALGYPEENPGDDELVAVLREQHDKTGPEPTRWRDALVGYEAQRDQIVAAALDGAQQPSPAGGCSCAVLRTGPGRHLPECPAAEEAR